MKALLSRSALWVALLSLLVESTGHAQTSPKRQLPNYDGRGSEPTSTGDALLWVPRVVLFPAYLVSEYVIRRPLGAAIAGAERAGIPDALYNFFMLNEEHTMGWAPTFLVDFGFKPSAGVYFFWDDALVKGNDLHVHAATWGESWLLGSITDRVHLNATDTWTTKFEALRRPDFRYYGQGPDSVEDNLSRYSADKLDASTGLSISLGGASRFESAVGFRSVYFRGSDSYPRRSIVRRVASGAVELPDGFERGYRAGISRLALRLDSRKPRPHSQSGLRLDLEAEQGASPGANAPMGWLRYRAIAGGFLDLNQRARVLSLSVSTAFSDPLTDVPVPFTEQVQLGGFDLMPGFLPGRLVGRSAAVATLAYHWPVWVWLDATLQTALGNVFDEHLSAFEWSRLRLSTAVGVETAGVSDNPFQLLIGFGTETFDHGAQINTLRVVFGTNRGF